LSEAQKGIVSNLYIGIELEVNTEAAPATDVSNDNASSINAVDDDSLVEIN